MSLLAGALIQTVLAHAKQGLWTGETARPPPPPTPHQSPAWSRLGFRAGLGLALQIRRPIVTSITPERMEAKLLWATHLGRGTVAFSIPHFLTNQTGATSALPFLLAAP